MKKILAGIILPILMINFITLTSCKNRAAAKQQQKAEQEQEKKIENQIEENVYPLPTSAEVIKMLTDLEVGYIIGISNPVANTKKYFQNTDRAINTGVYGADLSYATLYNMQQQVMDYLLAIRSLTIELNMSKIYNESLYDSIKKNYDNRNHLVPITYWCFQ